MKQLNISEKTKRLLFVLAGIFTVLIIIGVLFSDDGDSNKKESKAKTTTTTTTLPPANSQACEFFKSEILAAGLIVPDKAASASKDLKRCTYTDLNGGINYLTLFLGKPTQCDVLKNNATDPKNIASINADSYYFEVIDPTVIVKMKDRCFFVQGSKTLTDETSLVNMAKAIYDLFTSVDSTTTTTTVAVDPNVTSTTNAIPGQNTVVVPSTEASTTTTTKKK